MKKILIVVTILLIMLMTGCSKNEKIEGNNVLDNQNNEQQEIVNHELNKSFEERTKEFIELKANLESDELHRKFANVRQIK